MGGLGAALGALAGGRHQGDAHAMNEPRFTRPALWDDVLDLARARRQHRGAVVIVAHDGEVGKHCLDELIDEDFGEHHT